MKHKHLQAVKLWLTYRSPAMILRRRREPNCHHNVFIAAFTRHVDGACQIARKETIKTTIAFRAEARGQKWLVKDRLKPLQVVGVSVTFC
jgi:hypothetical protein